MSIGESGYVQATVQVTVGGTYLGGGLAGWSGGVSYQFNVKMREPEFVRPGQDTTDGAQASGVGGPTKVRLSMQGFMKGANYPVNFAAYEFVHVVVLPWTGLTFTGVVRVESFKPTGDVERPAEYTISGESDGAYTYQ